MFHLNSQILQSLLNGSVTPNQLQRIRQHVRECRTCAGRLEEWSDDHPSVARRFPTLERGAGDEARTTAGGLVMMPMASRILPAWLRPRQLIWTGVGLLLLGAASGSPGCCVEVGGEMVVLLTPAPAPPATDLS
jgi:hypothetical protein